ncbi:hypothetical protein Rsub_05681 [Raphidocelis subcapitata]|uniref:Uncharacterized protein n=1 Tax=Raphidocelis subcapitata TaxID=307507 RepID=A0A2V0P5E0_9CHLO|nr:hypothetical protein Rsub_05681 [Raphidocelis subcapitata]|eukprot:GBF93070.1 hypothetical protein Rsub_05681 [Raphidocelis subcapitata]
MLAGGRTRQPAAPPAAAAPAAAAARHARAAARRRRAAPPPPGPEPWARRPAAARGGGGGAADGDAGDGGAFGDKWENTLSVHHTLTSLYTPKVQLAPHQQIDHAARRRERELREIAEAGRKLGVSEAAVRSNARALETLVPGLAPNLDKMRASDWARLLADTGPAVAAVIALRAAFPTADLAAMIGRQPRLLLRAPDALAADAGQVRSMLSRCPDVDSIVQEVPDLLNPRELEQALAYLARTFPKEDTLALLQANPSILNNIGGEVDVEANAEYGRSFW